MNYMPRIFAGPANNETEAQADPPNTRSRAALTAQLNAELNVRARNRSPSPQPGQQFFPPNMADADALRYLAETAAANAASQASTQTAAALQNLRIGVRKPELPTFDSKNIDIWIRRTESAYIRAGVSTAKEKFAFLEAKIAVDFDPRINEFLYGDPTDENWISFLAYLRTTYGRTRRQEAASILDGTRRDGRRPTQLLSKIKEKAGSATIDDLFKELLMREMPQNVKHSLLDRMDTMTASEMATLADRYFDQEGRPLNQQASVSNIDAPEITENMTEQYTDENDVNAIGARPKNRFSSKPPSKPYTPAFGGHSSNNRTTPHFKGNSTPAPFKGNSAPRSSFANKNKSSLKSICHRHAKFGDETKFCEPGCMYWSKMQTGNESAGWRK